MRALRTHYGPLKLREVRIYTTTRSDLLNLHLKFSLAYFYIKVEVKLSMLPTDVGVMQEGRVVAYPIVNLRSRRS